MAHIGAIAGIAAYDEGYPPTSLKKTFFLGNCLPSRGLRRGYLPGKRGQRGEATRGVEDDVPEYVAWVVDDRSGPSNEIYGGSNMADNAKIVKSGL